MTHQRRTADLAGRPVLPGPLALTGVTASLVYANLTNHGLLRSSWSHWVIVALGSVAVVVLLGAWARRSETAMDWGLIAAAGVWTSRATLASLDLGPLNVTTLGSWWWAVLAVTCWLANHYRLAAV